MFVYVNDAYLELLGGADEATGDLRTVLPAHALVSHVRVTLRLTIQNNALVVPNQAVQTGQDGQFVYVVKGDKTLYRARFAGFQQKDEAEAVCKQLKLQDIDCITIKN
jgi:multidrug efflux pump subunit AcrA (membrane-fusion protein)